jgi:hypothetical protein
MFIRSELSLIRFGSGSDHSKQNNGMGSTWIVSKKESTDCTSPAMEAARTRERRFGASASLFLFSRSRVDEPLNGMYRSAGAFAN